MAEVFRTLTNRLRDSTWTIVFKGLIIVHLMIREGEPNVTLKYLADSPSKVAISNFSDGMLALYILRLRNASLRPFEIFMCSDSGLGIMGYRLSLGSNHYFANAVVHISPDPGRQHSALSQLYPNPS